MISTSDTGKRSGFLEADAVLADPLIPGVVVIEVVNAVFPILLLKDDGGIPLPFPLDLDLLLAGEVVDNAVGEDPLVPLRAPAGVADEVKVAVDFEDLRLPRLAAPHHLQ